MGSRRRGVGVEKGVTLLVSQERAWLWQHLVDVDVPS